MGPCFSGLRAVELGIIEPGVGSSRVSVDAQRYSLTGELACLVAAGPDLRRRLNNYLE